MARDRESITFSMSETEKYLVPNSITTDTDRVRQRDADREREI